jgi:hypothetical protein
MKKVFARVLAAVAILATGAASMGCIWLICDEPNASKLNLD